MSAAARDRIFRALPSLDALLRSPLGESWAARFPRRLLVGEARRVLDALREEIRGGRWDGSADGAASEVARRVEDRLTAFERPSLRAVINASGVILHTNLGRAPLSAAAVEAIGRVAGGYCNIEYDLEQGARGRRDAHVGELLEALLGAPAIVVNNNAAAIFLALHELAGDGETVVARGELIEIGDGFRVPDIMTRSGTRLREVGATNRVRIEDYRAALNADTRAVLRVHPSNFRIVGFTSRPSLEDLAALTREHRLPLIEDLGSGALDDLAPLGIADEPTVAASLAAGVDVLAFSGDKLLGGPQAGILAGRPDLIARLRRNPLFRALRVDKLTLAALAETLRAWLLERFEEIPAARMARTPLDEIRVRAERLASRVGGVVEAGESLLGGGSTPERPLPTWTVAIAPPAGRSAAVVEAALRRSEPAVIARVTRDRVVADLRTVDPARDELLATVLAAALAAPAPSGRDGGGGAARLH